MSNWPSSRSRRVLAALERIGWKIKRQAGSHRLLTRDGWPDCEFAAPVEILVVDHADKTPTGNGTSAPSRAMEFSSR